MGFIEGYAKIILTEVPYEIHLDAIAFVSAYRPDGQIPDPEQDLYAVVGFKGGDHAYLNELYLLSIEEQREIFAEKRAEYANDPAALQQIDVYGGESD